MFMLMLAYACIARHVRDACPRLYLMVVVVGT